jgi:methylenetetrahydrofolate dehydrogenase (NAD+)
VYIGEILISRSDTVGLPLASMFVNEGAIVFSIDIHSAQVWETHNYSLGACIATTSLSTDNIYAMSDIVISAVPSLAFKIPTKSLKPGVVAINVASGIDNFEADVRTRASRVAERMGSLTVMMLVLNALALRARS